MEEQPVRDKITYEYRWEETPKYCVVEEEWEIHGIFAGWKPGVKVLVFRKEVSHD